MLQEETWQVRVRGRVQGVGYRDACVRYARQAGVRGWVRNRSDGSVELMLQGSAAQVAAMQAWLRQSVPLARVTGMDAVQLAAPAAPLQGFERLPTA